jgi:hypothetical protein
MSASSTLAIVAVAGVAALALAAAIKAKLAGQTTGSAPAFKAKTFLTPKELSSY